MVSHHFTGGDMFASISKLFGDWHQLVEKSASVEDLEVTVEKGSIPSFSA